MAKITIVDPPSGWQFGFPKVVPQEILDSGEIYDWIIEQGYPEEKRNLLQYTRMWEAEE